MAGSKATLVKRVSEVFGIEEDPNAVDATSMARGLEAAQAGRNPALQRDGLPSSSRNGDAGGFPAER